jgi:hypothetical protein
VAATVCFLLFFSSPPLQFLLNRVLRAGLDAPVGFVFRSLQGQCYGAPANLLKTEGKPIVTLCDGLRMARG